MEFLAVIGPFLVLFFGLTQIGLSYGAHLMVSCAASKAARAAIAILPDDFEGADYAGDPLNQIGGGGDGLEAYRSAPEGGRLAAIRNAARLVLSPISASLSPHGSSSMADALRGPGIASILADLSGLKGGGTAVTFPDGSGGYRTSFDPTGMVTAKVTFLYKCSVPIADVLLCKRFDDLPPRVQAELGSSGDSIPTLARSLGWRVIGMEAERTMPNQGR